MQNPFLLVFLLGTVVGMMFGLYIGNPKFRKIIKDMLSRGGDDDGDDDYEEE